MKAILEFDLPDERIEHDNAVNGWRYYTSIYEFDQRLRQMEKHEDKESIDISECRDLLRDILFDNNVQL